MVFTSRLMNTISCFPSFDNLKHRFNLSVFSKINKFRYTYKHLPLGNVYMYNKMQCKIAYRVPTFS